MNYESQTLLLGNYNKLGYTGHIVSKQSGFLAIIWELIEAFVFALAIFVVVYWFLAQPNQVRGQSMFPTFHDGEYILTDKVTYKRRDPLRGEVVIFKSPGSADIDYIKRIIGLPGDTVMVSGGKLFLNGKSLNESEYLDASVVTTQESFLKEGQSTTVPEGKYFVVGDNRPHSSDSREFGPIAKTEFIGRVMLRYWPITKMGMVYKANYPNL